MRKTIQFFLTLLLLLLIPVATLPQDTFSIVALDTLTGEIGSAGASCVKASTTYPHGAAIISDVIPGRSSRGVLLRPERSVVSYPEKAYL